MSRADEATLFAPVFAALGDQTRLELVARLGDGRPQSIVELAGGFDLTRQGLTKHLQVLEKAGLVAKKRKGRESRYSIRPTRLQKARDYLARASAQWDENITRLRDLVED